MIEIPLLKIVIAFLAISIRITGIMLFAPFFGSATISPRIKASLVFASSILLYPIVSATLNGLNMHRWPLIVVHELLIGSAVGIATNLVFDAIQMAGQILSVQMGLSLVSLMDPQSQADSTVMALFHQTIAILIFLRLDVHLWILKALGKSFISLPPSTLHISSRLGGAILSSAGMVFAIGIQIAAPVFSATILMDIVLALLGRASPALPIMLLGPPVKTLLGLTLLFAALRYWPAMFERLFEGSLNLSNHLLSLAR